MGMNDPLAQGAESGSGWEQFGRWVASFLPSLVPDSPLPASAVAAAAGGDGGDEELQQQVADLMTQFDSLQAQIETVTGERDGYQQQVEALEANLSVVQDARATERFAAMVREHFAHLPPKLDELAEHVQWLYSMDAANDEGEQPHAAFFFELLQRADAQFAKAFKERGRQGEASDAMAMINVAVAKYQAENSGVDYHAALDAVLRANPALFQTYESQRGGA